MNASLTTKSWLQQPILPVVVLDSVDQGQSIAEGLLLGGISQIEITLRTPAALPSIHAIAKRFPDMAISAGTILSPLQMDQAADQGANLFISPGLTENLAEHAQRRAYSWVPGAATASEFMRAIELGFDLIKFFPAMAAGGPSALANISAPLPHIRVIPTGGISLENLHAWAQIPTVQAIGGSWITANLLGSTAPIVDTVAQRASLALNVWHGTALTH